MAAASLGARRLVARSVVASPVASTSYLAPSCPAAPRHRPFSSSSSSTLSVPRTGRPAGLRNIEKRDEAINSRLITLVKPEGGLTDEPVDLFRLLGEIDRKETFIVRVALGSSDGPSRYPICRVVNKKEAFEKNKELKNRVKSKASVQKNKKMSIQVSWLVTDNDISHRIRLASKHFNKRGKGSQVDFEIVTKKASSAYKNQREKQELIDKITEQMAAIKPGEAQEAADGAEDGDEAEAGDVAATTKASKATPNWKVKMAKEPAWSLDHKVMLVYEAA